MDRSRDAFQPISAQRSKFQTGLGNSDSLHKQTRPISDRNGDPASRRYVHLNSTQTSLSQTYIINNPTCHRSLQSWTARSEQFYRPTSGSSSSAVVAGSSQLMLRPYQNQASNF
ncbi:hypothetical protein TMatcc_001726 [Talaromyces marneffei ATCC 18224]